MHAPAITAPSPADRQPLRITELVLVAGSSLLFFAFAIGQRDFWAPNEPSYARVVVEMLESGDWLSPHLNGEVFAEKPVLTYWLGALSARALGGADEFTLRLPFALVSSLCAALIFSLVAPRLGRFAAWLAVGCFATQYVVWWIARTVQMDSWVLFSTLLSVYAIYRRLEGEWTPRRSWVVFGLSAGIGFLGKGPVTSVVPICVILAFCALARRNPLRLFAGLQWGILTFAVVGLPWYLALWRAGETAALNELLLRQNFSRFTDAWDHQRPWHYFPRYFWLSFAPWSWFVPLAVLVRKRLRGGAERSLEILGWAWILAPLTFFSLSESKRDPYLLPVAPGIAILVALVFVVLAREMAPVAARRAARTVIVVVGGVLMTGGTYLLAAQALAPEVPLHQGMVGVVLVLCGLVAVVGSVLARPLTAGALLAGSLACLYLFVAAKVHPTVDTVKSHRDFAVNIRDNLPASAELRSFFGPGSRKWVRGGGYAFYLGRVIPHLNDKTVIRRLWVRNPDLCILTEEASSDPDSRRLPDLPGRRLWAQDSIGSKRAQVWCHAELGGFGEDRRSAAGREVRSAGTTGTGAP